MKTVLVAGAASGIGESIVRALLASPELNVLATSRSAERLEQLRQRLDPPMRASLTAIAGDAGDFAGAEDLARQIDALGGLDAAVAIFGRGEWTSGPTLELDPAEWRSVLDEMLTAHFAFARAIVPLLARREGSLYVSLGGSAAFEPASGAGLMSIAGSGQAMLSRILAREVEPNRPCIVELVIEGSVRTRRSSEHDGSGRIDSDDVGRVVAELILDGATTWEPAAVAWPIILMKPRAPSR